MHQSLSSRYSSGENTHIHKADAFSQYTLLTPIAHADSLIEDDNAQLKNQGIQSVKMPISWQQAETIPYFYNWDAVTTALENAKKNGMEPIWDLCYFGFPDDVTPLQPNFVRRFAAFCRAFVRYYKYKEPDAILTLAPVDETAFVSSGTFISTNQEAMSVLAGACAEAISAMKEEDPNICILTNHPVADIIPLLGETSLAVATLAIAS